MNHCCELMTTFVNDPRIPLDYYSRFRKYYIPLIGSAALQGISYCPWCGILLPAGLHEKYFYIVETEYGDDENKLPEEFKTDEWWKKRNL